MSGKYCTCTGVDVSDPAAQEKSKQRSKPCCTYSTTRIPSLRSICLFCHTSLDSVSRRYPIPYIHDICLVRTIHYRCLLVFDFYYPKVPVGDLSSSLFLEFSWLFIALFACSSKWARRSSASQTLTTRLKGGHGSRLRFSVIVKIN